ncbi:MAG: zeta toxin family protein [Candidatus Saccharimonas sp.]|nr:zeta toxin family protein [Candidatus Saccharimonas sp.]
MAIEDLIKSKEFDQSIPTEIEQKFIPLFPERLSLYREQARPIEQYYLSHPDEPFSLRMRSELSSSGELLYTATLKNAGHVTQNGLERMEIEAVVTESLYTYFFDESTPIIRKLRATPLPGIVIDFYDDERVQIESESLSSWEEFCRQHGDVFVDVSSDKLANNQWQAHIAFRRSNNGNEALLPQPELSVDTIIADILALRLGRAPVVVHVGGRSGSGKSTIVRQIQSALEQYSLSSVVLSTDDYHRGASALAAINNGEPWIHWDDPIVYDTKAMAKDLANLYEGSCIYRREINWASVEPSYTSIIKPSDVVIIEGIYAQSPVICGEHDLVYEMTTPLATCIGRRLLRDMRERPEFADPVKSLGYMLNEAEPAYRAQERAER